MFCSLNSEHDLRGAVPAQVKRLPIMSEQYFITHDGVDADDLATVGFDFTEVFNIFEFGGDPINVVAMQRWERLVNKLINDIARTTRDDDLLVDASHVLAPAEPAAPQMLSSTAAAPVQPEPLPQARPIDMMQMMHWRWR